MNDETEGRTLRVLVGPEHPDAPGSGGRDRVEAYALEAGRWARAGSVSDVLEALADVLARRADWSPEWDRPQDVEALEAAWEAGEPCTEHAPPALEDGLPWSRCEVRLASPHTPDILRIPF